MAMVVMVVVVVVVVMLECGLGRRQEGGRSKVLIYRRIIVEQYKIGHCRRSVWLWWNGGGGSSGGGHDNDSWAELKWSEKDGRYFKQRWR
jgi:uncharacterized membrane protein YgcG